MIFGGEKKPKKTAHDFIFTSIKGGVMPLEQYKGKVIFLVNTASKCGFTKQYADLQKLWEKYKHKGFVVIGVPCNDFGRQEPAGDDEIKKFCRMNYGVDFPLASKEMVKGKYAHPFFQWAKEELGGHTVPRWNFHKYLISPEGELVDFFIPFTNPMAKRVIAAIERYLPK